MAGNHAETVRRALAAFAATHQPSGYVRSDFVWDMRHLREFFIDAREYHGLDDFMANFFRKWIAPYDEWQAEAEEIREVDEERVVVALRQRGRLKGSSAWVDALYGAVYSFDSDGQIARITWYLTPGAAREAVGLTG